MSDRFTSYAEFWPHYLREHGQAGTRALHFTGTGLALVFLITAIVTVNGWFLLAAVISGYAFAWIGHLAIEHNRPATFSHPVWSLVSDFRMSWCWITGRLAGELEKAGVAR